MDYQYLAETKATTETGDGIYIEYYRKKGGEYDHPVYRIRTKNIHFTLWFGDRELREAKYWAEEILKNPQQTLAYLEDQLSWYIVHSEQLKRSRARYKV